jgi:2-haloacid dehalogenase
MADIQTIVFDLGGVLIDWNPRYLYRELLKTENEIEFFLNHICTSEWNAQQDAGRTFRDGVALLQKQYPHYADLIAVYETRWGINEPTLRDELR